jgi:AraC family transcriptional regulator, regulatory protein of adaptative response / methylated-DNA-[protein]-cysteine methyltransferase
MNHPRPPDAADVTTADPRWAQVVAREPAADGQFVYSVRTTGVYCRPSCPSRLARPENVRFHDTVAAAETAGFRACKRCRPNQPLAASAHGAIVATACRRIEVQDKAPTLSALASVAGMSEFHFHRVFKRLTGLTPRQYAAAHKTRRVRDALAGPGTVTNAIIDAGYGSSSRFYERSDAILGMTPRRYQRGGVDQHIRFAVGDCALGVVLVAASDKGVCAILLGDDPEALVHDLQDRFPQAHLEGGDAGFDATVAQVVGLIDAPGQRLELPLDVRGTAFQQRVWLALRDIPPGTTASYAEIAAKIGAPNSFRAVAQACGANTLAVAIPCHRVVRTDGGLSGYRWGVARKRALLQRETDASTME